MLTVSCGSTAAAARFVGFLLIMVCVCVCVVCVCVCKNLIYFISHQNFSLSCSLTFPSLSQSSPLEPS